MKGLNALGDGTTASLITALNWVAAHASTIDVANMSLGCECYSAALSTAVRNVYNAGVTVVAAAGNESIDTSLFWPAADPHVIAVAAMNDYDGVSGGLGSPPDDDCDWGPDDQLADYSDYGSTVAITAPGTCIEGPIPGDHWTCVCVCVCVCVYV